MILKVPNIQGSLLNPFRKHKYVVTKMRRIGVIEEKSVTKPRWSDTTKVIPEIIISYPPYIDKA